MEINTLVTHKTLETLGIGCVSKVLKDSVVVNFGKYDTMKCKNTALNIIDTSACKTVTLKEVQNGELLGNPKFKDIIIGNELMQYVGIGYVTIRVIEIEDLIKYPRVI